eukprot:TRINITY_DN24890_c0_g3_i1.p1 TRINITY_DN24890_c0_g3~~TRINITY_DN24890_c0_g3_i1.p1  ORF type:complete len:563 (+),score=78.00 TRINITY_DN24890_c0_g3_i1:46-1689(+)
MACSIYPCSGNTSSCGDTSQGVIEEIKSDSRGYSEDVADDTLQRLESILCRIEKYQIAQFETLTKGVQKLGDEFRELQRCTATDTNRQTIGEVRGVRCPTTQVVGVESRSSLAYSMNSEASVYAEARTADRRLHSTKMHRLSDTNIMRFGTNELKDDFTTSFARVRRQVSRLVGWKYFDTMMGFVVSVNCIIVGLRVDGSVKGRGAAILQTIEEATVFVYVVELFLRIFSGGYRIFKDEFIIFDALIVFGGITSFIDAHSDAFLDTSGFGALTVIKTARLLRLIRSMRLLWTFQVLGKLVNGMFHSLNGMISVLLLILLFLYIFSCVGLEMIRDDPKLIDDAIVETHFASLPVTMLTLFGFVTLDSISTIYFPLITKRPLLVFFFISLILVMSIALVNLITAFILDASIQRSHSDREMDLKALRRQIKKLRPEIRAAFMSLDLNKDGHISKTEVIALTDSLPSVLTDHVKADSMLELFELVDDDDSGSISLREFEDAIIENACRQNADLHIMKLLRIQKRRLAELADCIQDLPDRIGRCSLEGAAPM